MATTLESALLWYQKKIGLYDQQLWERTVEQHILRNVEDLPKKLAKLKPELIDVDLVRGSAFPKAKPQHGWISNTSSGVLRVLFMPVYCGWWRRQTSTLVCSALLALYVTQLAIMYAYFTGEEEQFQDVSTCEITTPVAMMIVLGIVHSQIVATVSSKISHTALRRSKRKRLKRLQPRISQLEHRPTPPPPVEKKNSDEESGLDSLDFAQQSPDLPPPTNCSKEGGDASSGEEYFISRKLEDATTRRSSMQVPPPNNNYWRRFSDIDNVGGVGGSHSKVGGVDRVALNDALRRFSEGHSYRRRLEHLSGGGGGVGEPPYSSCESEEDTTPTTPKQPLLHGSDVEWPIMTNTDCNSDSTDSPAVSDQEEEDEEQMPSSFEDPVGGNNAEGGQFFIPYSGSDKGTKSTKVSCAIWERNECKKVDLTVLDISSAIVLKVDSLTHSSEYLFVGLLCALLIALMPPLFRIQSIALQEVLQDVISSSSEALMLSVPTPGEVVKVTEKLQEACLGPTIRSKLVIVGALLERFTLSAIYFFILSVAERTFKQRFLYAKHFCHLTSVRRARRSDLPHFRLNKVRNIKTWLSVRSYLKKHGPQRSVDVVVSTAFVLIVCLLSFLCVQLLKESDQFVDRLYCWEIVFWCLALGIFLMRFMILGAKINKKYRNLSALTTEQINLYLHMEQKPHKKDELMLANNVLKLAIDLLKELESPFKISGLRANPYLYNITKVVVLSAFSAVLTELLGFKLKLHKIKIK